MTAPVSRNKSRGRAHVTQPEPPFGAGRPGKSGTGAPYLRRSERSLCPTSLQTLPPAPLDYLSPSLSFLPGYKCHCPAITPASSSHFRSFTLHRCLGTSLLRCPATAVKSAARTERGISNTALQLSAGCPRRQPAPRGRRSRLPPKRDASCCSEKNNNNKKNNNPSIRRPLTARSVGGEGLARAHR